MSSFPSELETVVVLHQQGRVSEAESHCREFLLTATDHPEALYLLGSLLLDQARADEALVQFQRVLSLTPTHGDAWLKFTEALLALDRPREALEIIEDLIAKGLDWPRAIELRDGAREVLDGKAYLTPVRETMPNAWRLHIAEATAIWVPADLNRLATYALLEQEDWYEPERAFIARLAEPGMTILDLGANHGVYALTLAARLRGQGRVIAVEPASIPADLLERSIAENGFGDTLIPHRIALSNRQGEGRLLLDSEQDRHRLAPDISFAGDMAETATETVAVTTLDALSAEGLWPADARIDLVKLDLGGHELQALQGARLFLAEQDPLLLFNAQSAQHVDSPLRRLLRQAGYSLYRLIPGLSALLPLEPLRPLDLFDTKLFACKATRAERLKEAGFLFDRSLHADALNMLPTGAPEIETLLDWRQVFAERAHAAVISQWITRADARDPHGSDYERALNTYLTAINPNQPLASRVFWLRQSIAVLDTLRLAGDHHFATATLHFRVLLDSGERRAAIQFGQILKESLDQGLLEARLDRPLIPAHPSHDHVTPTADPRDWFCNAFVDGLARARHLSSFLLADPDALREIEEIARRPGAALPAIRRLALVKLRAGKDCSELDWSSLWHYTQPNAKVWDSLPLIGTRGIVQFAASVTQPVIVLDGLCFQCAPKEIKRIWRLVFKRWVATEFASHLLILDRDGTAPRYPGLRYLRVPAHEADDSQNDMNLLQALCDQEQACLFISTYYSAPRNTLSMHVAHDRWFEPVTPDVAKYVDWAERHSLARAVSYVAPSRFMAREINRVGRVPMNAILVARAPIDIDLFQPVSSDEIDAFKRRYRITRSYFMLPGTHRAEDNQWFFSALARLDNALDFDILVIGKTLQYPADLQDQLPRTRLHYLHLGDSDLCCAYAGAQALVVASRAEGFGISIAEAMACGCPVIATRVGATPELAADEVFYVGPGNIPELHEALRCVQNPETRAAFGDSALRHARQLVSDALATTIARAAMRQAGSVSSSRG